MKNIWKNGIMGVVTGDALGCPVQFEARHSFAPPGHRHARPRYIRFADWHLDG